MVTLASPCKSKGPPVPGRGLKILNIIKDEISLHV